MKYQINSEIEDYFNLKVIYISIVVTFVETYKTQNTKINQHFEIRI